MPQMGKILPSIELIERSRELLEATVAEMGKLTLETVLAMSAIEVAGEPQQGKQRGEVRHHGSQGGYARVGGKRMKIERPRLRSKDGKEVPVPAYEMLKKDPQAAERALGRVLKGVSTRDYAGIFDEAGQELGVSRSSVSRESSKAAERALKDLMERPLQERQLAIFIDGTALGECVAVTAIGIGESGLKRVLGLSEGATENAASVGALLDSIIERGLDPSLATLFVVDGSKALAKAIRARFPAAVIQRCQIHKLRNVLEHLPLAKRDYYKAKLDVAFRLPYEQAQDKLEMIAKEIEVLHPGAAASLREGLSETLTVLRLRLPGTLVPSLRSTNLIESSFSRAKGRLRRFTNFSSGAMALKWCAAALSLAEQGFRRVRGVKDLWVLKAALDQLLEAQVR